ncbi:MAG: 16S rRNA (cytidine(1402)-2'-O)-methyltransferase, partial [Elusimicrobia bacterium]|nr:16S rRNA (cytidine(1402)-2'-O)-methyltransferase [Elusimicrobiota bacterium]
MATPIGNLSDITVRALEVLKQVDLIACENTVHTLKLLNHYGLQKTLLTIFGPRETRGTERVLFSLSQRMSVALLSDAGTPAISDPGNELVRQVREEGYRIEPIPGPSAVACALSVSGCAEKGFIFLGFLHRSKGKMKKEILAYENQKLPIVFFESPFRIVRTLRILSEILGRETFCWVGREMTKKFEETLS